MKAHRMPHWRFSTLRPVYVSAAPITTTKTPRRGNGTCKSLRIRSHQSGLASDEGAATWLIEGRSQKGSVRFGGSAFFTL